MSLVKRETEVQGDVVTERYTDDSTGQLIINKTQDVAPILERNKIVGETNNGYTEDRSLQEVADIPMVVWAMWRKELSEKGIDINTREGMSHVIAKLNDPDNAAFRSGKGHL